jgi:hypothetical protein
LNVTFSARKKFQIALQLTLMSRAANSARTPRKVKSGVAAIRANSQSRCGRRINCPRRRPIGLAAGLPLTWAR